MAAENGVSINTSWFSLQGPGMFIVVVVLIIALVYNFTSVQETMRLTQQEHQAIVRALTEVNGSLNDVFIGVMTPPEVKQNLPLLLREKLREKSEERAKEKVNTPSP